MCWGEEPARVDAKTQILVGWGAEIEGMGLGVVRVWVGSEFQRGSGGLQGAAAAGGGNGGWGGSRDGVSVFWVRWLLFAVRFRSLLLWL